MGAEVPQNDAGSGRDAPNARADDITIVPGVVYDGLLVPGLDAIDFYAFDARAGQTANVSLTGSPVCAASIIDPEGRPISAGCGIPTTAGLYSAPITRDGTYYIRVSTFASAYRFAFALDAEAPDPLGRSEPGPAAGTDPTCGLGIPVTRTAGERNGVVFAALKTGFRAVVAWSTPVPSIESITFTIDMGESATLTEAAPRTHHVFILDGLPIGRSLCFFTSSGVFDALRLANAMNAHDGTAYSLNLLVTATENVRGRDTLEAGLDIFAQKLFDATDGHVRAGKILVLYMDPEHANTGTTTCSSLGVQGRHCDKRVDATFSHDSCIGGAACAPLDGIRYPSEFIMMNSVFQAHPILGSTIFGPNEAGTVLLHEFGHYAFGAMDLYAGSDCWSPTTMLSVMGGNRGANEFDDAVHRCPNEAAIPGYVPTWTLMKARFPLIPERTGPIDAGPHGGGGIYARYAYDFVPRTV